MRDWREREVEQCHKVFLEKNTGDDMLMSAGIAGVVTT